MDALSKTLQNSGLGAPKHVLAAIENASQKTGVDFSYMVQQAAAESSFQTKAKAKTSSATGLYQFINRTWLNMIDKYGEKHGIDTTGMSRKEILDLRYDPEISSQMAAELANENKQFLDIHWGGEVGSTELYFAHFMGAGKAAAFLKAKDENGLQTAAYLFPKEAAANYNVFYDSKNGRARTMDEVYNFFDKKFTPVNVPTPSVKPSTDASDSDQPIAETLVAEEKKAIFRSAVFIDGQNENQLDGFEMARYKNANAMRSIYQGMLANPLDLIMMTQLEIPGVEDNLENRTFGRKATIF